MGYLSKNHSATLCFLIYHYYHREGLLKQEDVELVASSLSKEDIETIGFSKEARERASYEVHESFEEKLARDIRDKATDFVTKVKTILSQE